MQDWMGNVAQEGDLLHFVNIKEITGPLHVNIDPNTGDIIGNAIGQSRYGWQHYYTTRVFEQEGVLFCQMPAIPGYPYNALPVNFVYEEWRDTGGWEMGAWICIERNKEDDKFNTLDEEAFYGVFFFRGMSNLN